MRTRWLLVAALAVPLWAHAQSEPRVIVVPYPGEARPDAGQPAVADPPPPPPPVVNDNPPPPQPPPPQPPPPQPPPPEQKTIEANVDTGEPPPPPPPDNLQPKEVPAQPPSAMLDGHPREGAFLSGPGSLAFILHHTLLGLTAGVATQLMPRVTARLADGTPDHVRRSCNGNDEASACGQSARLAYLGAGLIGAGLGFATSAAWQFYNWMSERSAFFGMANSAFGAMFGAGLVNLITGDVSATTWALWVGALVGGWLSVIVGGGDLPMNKGLLMLSGGYWAMLFTGCIVGIIAATNRQVGDTRPGIDALLISPAIGAGAMALALLKFNPSSAQVLRADLFGTLAGIAVYLISGFALGPNFGHWAPYLLGGLAAAGAITTVSLLWAEAAENPSPVDTQTLTPGGQPATAPKPKYKGYW